MVLKSLRVWFVIHFVLDVLLAVPLLLAPEFTLTLFGWQQIDPLATRLVGAALMGIGVESLLGRNAGVEAFQGMLNLKIIWSGTAVLGIVASLLTGGPRMVWVFLIIFVVFFIVWGYYRLRLR